MFASRTSDHPPDSRHSQPSNNLRARIAEHIAQLGHTAHFSALSASARLLSTMQSSLRYVLLALGILVCVSLLMITSTVADIFYLDKVCVCPVYSASHSAILTRPFMHSLHYILSFSHEEYGKATSLQNIADKFSSKGSEYVLPPSIFHNQTGVNRKASAAFVILARNSDLKSIVESIKHVEDRFNRKLGYPYVFLNEEPFSEEFKRSVIRRLCARCCILASHASATVGLRILSLPLRNMG